MSNNIIIAVTGMTGSGKSVVTDILQEEGFAYLRFGQITLDIVKERGLEPTEENERPIRESMRDEHGMAAYAVMNLPKIEALLENSNVVVDGLYSWSEQKFLEDKFGDNFYTIAVQAPPELRYDRLAHRELKAEDTDLRNRPATRAAARARDFAEIEKLEKGGPIAMANFPYINRGSVDDLATFVRGYVLPRIKDGHRY